MPTEDAVPASKPQNPGSRGTLPQHAKNHGAEQRSDEEAKQGLDVIHDALEIHHEIRSADGNGHANYGGPTAHADIVLIGRVFFDERAIDVVGPDRRKGADVACHAGHESRNERGDAEAKQSWSAITGEHQGEDFVVAMATGGYCLRFADEFNRQQREGEKTGQDDDERYHHLETGADDGSHFRGAKIFGR